MPRAVCVFLLWDFFFFFSNPSSWRETSLPVSLFTQDSNQTNLTQEKEEKKNCNFTRQLSPSQHTNVPAHQEDCVWMHVCVCVCELWPLGTSTAFQHRQRHTVFMALKWQRCGCRLYPLFTPQKKKRDSPFLRALHHQLLIWSHKLEFGSMLPHTLQSFPNRGHGSAWRGIFSVHLSTYPVLLCRPRTHFARSADSR